MDLGIVGKSAVVCASSRGLGRACAFALAQAGCNLVINGRDGQKLLQTAEEIRSATGVKVIAIAADVTTQEGQKKILDAAGQVDILVNNAGGPPPRDFREVDREALLSGVISNMASPIEMIQHVIDGMVARRFGRIVNITSGSVKMPLAGLDLSSGARLGLTGFLAGVARSVAHANVTINFLLPGPFDTDRLRSLQAKAAEQRGVGIEIIRTEKAATVPAKRFGDPAEFGAACAFLCSSQSGFITGQSLLIDGGVYPGVL